MQKKTPTPPRKAIGIVRVSEVGDREGDSFASPHEQRARIEAACERDGIQLVEVINELDVSGGTPLERRAGLRRAIEAVEAGEVEVVVAAYFDRLVRSLKVQGELVERVEDAGGSVLAVDVGAVTNGSAGQWLSATMLGAVAEYHRRSTKERTAGAQARAIERGVPPFPNIPPGYRRAKNGKLEPHPREAKVVADAFELRAGGATVAEVREHLRSHGIKKSYHGVGGLLSSKLVLGEIHFGDQVNLHAYPPIVEREVWERVQRLKLSRGRKPKSDRLLARQGILRCGSCGARMVIGTSNSRYFAYRCPPTGDCKHRMAISADIVENVVVNAVKDHLADVEGRASVERGAREAEQQLERAQADLDGAIRLLAGFEDEAAARERLVELRAARDAARERVEQLGHGGTASVTATAADWDRLSLEGRRDLIRATVERVEVLPGRGAERVALQLLGE